MKLSENTLSVMKNFSTINQNLLIKPGKTLSTMSAMKNIVATAKVEEDFKQQIAFYDLNEFLVSLSLFSEADLKFEENFVIISEDNKTLKLDKTLKYWYSDASIVTTPTKIITMPSVEVTFTLSKDILSDVTKAAAVIGAPDMVLEDGKLSVTNKKNDTSNDYSIKLDVSSEENKKYKFWFKAENLKFLSGTYDVEISSKKITHFVNKNLPIEYFVALESESTYNNG
tara:strand:+ start:9960 stop:10640 length:681 start_codon:yes stop_codon:yes gene_type:complete